MATSEIMDKLRILLTKENVFAEECEVVYFMVEARKVIDQQKLSFPVLKFYADWCVHSSKDKITPEIEMMSESMYDGAVARINDPNSPEDYTSAINDFVYMVNLRAEIGSFLTDLGLPSDLAYLEEDWIRFVVMLTRVLENQPINNPSTNVQTILFEPATPGCVIGTLVFKQPVGGYPSFSLKNVY